MDITSGHRLTIEITAPYVQQGAHISFLMWTISPHRWTLGPVLLVLLAWVATVKRVSVIHKWTVTYGVAIFCEALKLVSVTGCF